MGPLCCLLPSVIPFRDRGKKVGQQGLPTATILGAPFLACRPEPLPAPVLDLHPGGGTAVGGEVDLNLGGVAAVLPDVPEVDQPFGGLPDRHLPPVVLDTIGRSFVDPSPAPPLEHDRKVGPPRRGVIARPPAGDPGGPHRERVLR